MNNIYRIQLTTKLLLTLALIVTVLFSQGCTEPQNVSTIKSLSANDDYAAFAAGTDRPPTAKTLYAMARILSIQGKDAQAEFLLRRVIQEYPKFIPARNSLAELQMRQRHVTEAAVTISDALEFNPKDPLLLNNLGMCRLVQRNYEDALEMFTRAAGVIPENAKYRANMATALAFMHRDDEALSLYKQILPEDEANHNLDVIRSARKQTN